jgi:hypothetical protein
MDEQIQLAEFDLDGYELDDGEAINREAPDTFWIPSLESRCNLHSGQIVKLIFRIHVVSEEVDEVHVERMWVKVTGRSDSLYTGELDNQPYCTNDMSPGFRVAFEPRHIINIYEG